VLVAPTSAHAQTTVTAPPAQSDSATTEQRVQPSQEALAETPTDTRAAALALTVSGGVSLGSYQAGYLYYLTQTLERDPKREKLVMAAGASAGSVNALLALMASCSPAALRPEDSLFWKVWTEVGLRQLYVRNDVSAINLFSRRALRASIERVRKLWQQGLPTSCDVVLGVTATRLIAKEVALAGELATIPRTEEKFLLRIRGRGRGREPLLTNYLDANFAFGQALLPLEGANVSPFESLLNLLLASSAFPLAFSPHPISFCLSDPAVTGVARGRCTLKDAVTELFIDGGVFDNRPIRLAARVAAAGLEISPDGQAQWKARPTFEKLNLPKGVRFAFLDATSRAYPLAPETAAETEFSTAFSLILHLIENFVSTAQSKELLTMLEVQPDVRNRIDITENYFPRASELMASFFGFFERMFRIFDFYLGMYDARRFLTAHHSTEVIFPEEAGLKKAPASWAPLLCMRGVFDGNPQLARLCAHPSLRDFRILLQTSLDRLYDNCRRLTESRPIPTVTHSQCRAALSGSAPMRVPGMGKVADNAWRREKDEGEIVYVLRLLSTYQFHFKDLGLSRRRTGDVTSVISAKLHQISRDFAHKQDSTKSLIELVARYAANQIAYVPPQDTFYGLLGRRLEIGYTGANPLSYWNWLRLGFSVAVDDLFSVVSSERDRFAVTPYLGLEIEPIGLNDALFQWRLGIRGGFRFSSIDGWVGRRCEVDTPNICSGIDAQLYIALTLLSVIRLQVSGSWFPPIYGTKASDWAIIPNIGIQLDDFF